MEDDDSFHSYSNEGGSMSANSIRRTPDGWDDPMGIEYDGLMLESHLRSVLTFIFNRNMVWDIALQMQTLRDMNRSTAYTRLTSLCYCPYGKIHKD